MTSEQGNMRLDTLLEGIRQIRIVGEAGREVQGITEDSRKVRPGFLFACLKGSRTDGSQFVEDALARGAAAILAQEGGVANWPYSIPVVLSENPRKTLAEISSAFYARPSADLMVVGVTGTNGKTTTTSLVQQMLCSSGIPAGWIGTVGVELGGKFLPATHTTPSAVDLQSLLSQMRAQGLKAVSMEVSSHALDQHRADAIDFDAAVFTNLTRDHLDYHGDFDAYLESKMRLFGLLAGSRKGRRCAVVNIQDGAFEKIRAAVQTPLMSFGIETTADVSALNVCLSARGSSFDLHTPAGKIKILLPILGRFNVANALAAAAAGLALGLDLDVVAQALSRAQAPSGRMEFIRADQPFEVVVDYAHTDDALRNVLQTVREFVRGRVLVVFGCGGDRDRSKRPLMGQVAGEWANKSFLTSDNPRSEDPRGIIREIEKGFARKESYTVIEDRAQAIARAIREALPGDLVLIAGKGHEQTQTFSGRTIPFCDRAVAREAIEKAMEHEGCATCKR